MDGQKPRPHRVDRGMLGVLTLAVLVRVALALSGFVVAGAEAFMAGDSGNYLGLAAALASDGRFGRSGVPEVFRTPGYPLLLAVLPDPAPAWIVVLQILVATATVWLVMVVVQRLAAGRRATILAGVLASLDPVFVFWTVKVMPETAWTAAIAALTVTLLAQLTTPHAARAMLAGALLGVQAYLKPAGYFLIPLAPLLLLVLASRPWRQRVAHAVLCLAVSVAVVLPWHVRNYEVAKFAGFSTLAARAVYFSAGASVAAHRSGDALARVRDQRREGVASAFGSDTAAAVSFMRGRGLEEIRSAPLRYALVHAGGMARTLLDPGAVEYLRYFDAYPRQGGMLMRIVDRGTLPVIVELWKVRPGLMVLNVVLGLWLLLLLAAAAYGAMTIPGRAATLLVAVASYFVLVSGGPHGSSRFRHPLVPVLAVLAGPGIARAREGGRRPHEVAGVDQVLGRD